MSDPNLISMLTSDWGAYPLVFAVIFASLAGSSHCAAMCGPVSVLLKNNRESIHFYNLGRLITYLLLGFIAGTVGKEFLNSHYGWISGISTLIISSVIIYLGLKLLLNKNAGLHLPNAFSFLFSRRLKFLNGLNRNIRSLIIGIINGFIPCGWLYVFVLASITLKSSLMGAVLMFFFWLGTVPAMTFLPLFSDRALRLLPVKYIRVAGVILILAGVFNLMINFLPADNVHHHGHKISKNEITSGGK